jgi:hypothetical protein
MVVPWKSDPGGHHEIPAGARCLQPQPIAVAQVGQQRRFALSDALLNRPSDDKPTNVLR